MLLRRGLNAALCAALLSLPTACHADEAAIDETSALPELGLAGTIPIYWGETGNFGDLLAGGGEGHWARARLEAGFRLNPLDTLTGESLAGIDFLLLAQPRAPSPAENVALDAWVRAGGRLLLFADPMMTGESRYAIGDRRRPQDVILLSPILRHWGLTLEFDDDRDPGPALVRGAAASIPVNLPGALTLGEGEADCRMLVSDVLASCSIGEGRAVILADAALLDLHQRHPAASAAFDWLVAQSFGRAGESMGQASSSSLPRQ